MDKMVKKEIKSALSFAKQTVKFVFFKGGKTKCDK